MNASISKESSIHVKSHVPGRIRLRGSTPDKNHSVLNALNTAKKNHIVHKIRVNHSNKSILIHYDRSKYSSGDFLKMLSSWDCFSNVELGNKKAVCNKCNKIKHLMTIPWSVKSRVPGRIRLHHPAVAKFPVVTCKIDLILLNMEGIGDYSVNGISSNVLVKYDKEKLRCDELVGELNDVLADVLQEQTDIESDPALRQLSLSTAVMGLALGSAIPVLASIALFGTALVASHIIISAFKAIFVEKKIKVDILDAVVILMSLAFGHIFTAALMVWIVDLSDYLLESSSCQSKKLLTKVFGKQTRKSWLLQEDGSEVECKVSNLKPGCRIVVRSGEQIPVDGVVLNGEAVIDQHVLTGESVPVEKTVNDEVFAMTVVMAGRITVDVHKIGTETNAAKIVKVIENSMQHKVRLQSTGERFADTMVLPTLGLGVLGFMLGGPSSSMAIINSDFGTGIRVAGPIALMASLSLAAKHGIIIKNGSILETLSDMDAIIFDKTGTLTQDIPEVGRIIPCHNFNKEEVLAYIAGAEQKFTHPIAKAIIQKADELNLKLPEIDESDCHIGFGIEVSIKGKQLKVGSLRYMERENINIPEDIREELAVIHKEGKSAVFAALDNNMIGVLEIQASQRAEAFQVIKNLKEKRGIKEIYLISGDHEAATKATAEQLGIEKYFAEVSPQDKGKYVTMLQEKGLKVAMVGDGINDSVALSKADFSISLRGASEVAADIADIVFMDGHLAKFDCLFQISDKLRSNVRRSFAFVIIPNVLGITGALFEFVGLTFSLLLNNGFNFLVTLNGMLPYYSLLEEPEQKI